MLLTSDTDLPWAAGKTPLLQRRWEGLFCAPFEVRDYESVNNPLFSAVDAYYARMVMPRLTRSPVSSDLIIGLGLRAWTK